jgi:predicted TIM-barrel fold metal-dependent hydrolase
MQAAWLTFATAGRREHPPLRVVFALLAGGAPLLSERLAARGGPPIELDDPLTFYESSSYGPAAIEAMAARVGPERLVYGSDRPVIEPTPTGRDEALQTNAMRLVGTTGAPAAVAA